MDDGPWFCSISDAEIGPLDANGLKEMARSGAIHAHDKVRLGHDGKWKLASTVPGLFDALAEVTEDDVILGETPYVHETTAVPLPAASAGPWADSPVRAPPIVRASEPVRAEPAPVRLQLARPEGPPPWVRTAINVAVGGLLAIIALVAGLMIYWGSQGP